MSPSNSFNGLEMWYLSENYLCSVFFWSFHVSVNLKKSLGNTLKKKKEHIKTTYFYLFQIHFWSIRIHVFDSETFEK